MAPPATVDGITVQPEITQRDLRTRSKEIMDAVQGGQAFTVTRDGHRIGELVPLRRRRRFVPRSEFAAMSRTAPDLSPKVVTAWRARAAVESPSQLRDHPVEVTLTLLATLLYCREREITDTLVELLISTVHPINARADRSGGLALTRSSPERSGCGAVCLGFGGCEVGVLTTWSCGGGYRCPR